MYSCIRSVTWKHCSVQTLLKLLWWQLMRLIKSCWNERFLRVGKCGLQICQAFSCTSPLKTKEVLFLDMREAWETGVVESLALCLFHRRKRADLLSDWRFSNKPKAVFTFQSLCVTVHVRVWRFPVPKSFLQLATAWDSMCWTLKQEFTQKWQSVIIYNTHTYINFNWKQLVLIT